jgi:hypothetical protein
MKRVLLGLVLLCGMSVVVGCGEGNRVGKPANTVEKLELSEKDQKKAGDFAPGP